MSRISTETAETLRESARAVKDLAGQAMVLRDLVRELGREEDHSRALPVES